MLLSFACHQDKEFLVSAAVHARQEHSAGAWLLQAHELPPPGDAIRVGPDRRFHLGPDNVTQEDDEVGQVCLSVADVESLRLVLPWDMQAVEEHGPACF